MTKYQLIAVLSAMILFLVLYFGCETKPNEQQAIEAARALVMESTDIKALLPSAKKELTPQQSANVLALEKQQEAVEATDTLGNIQILKDLSSKWYQLGHPEIAGFYAEQVAEIDNSEEAWSIAGTTYTICLQRMEEEKVRAFCTERSIRAYENAVSLNPASVSHQTNLALVYTENPPQENPMKGILMLIDLNKKNPDNTGVLFNLGRLAIKTGQFDKAIERLETVIDLEGENRSVVCLLAQAYNGKGNVEKSETYRQKCAALSNVNDN